MKMRKITIIVLINFLLLQISSQILPCDNYWKYTVGSDQATQGLVTLYPKNYQTHSLKISLTIATQLPSNDYGNLGLVKDTQSTVNDIENGRPILYRVRFPVQNPLPKLKALYYNDDLLCSAPSSNQNDGYVTTIKLNHNLYTKMSIQSSIKSQNAPHQIIVNRQNFASQKPSYAVQEETTPIIIPKPMLNRPSFEAKPTTFIAPMTRTLTYPTTTKIPQLPSKIESTGIRPGKFDEINSQCGIPKYSQPDSIGLVVKGKTAIRGQFPWLAALYNNGFKCGGSIISTKLVLTAAHCIQAKNQDVPRKAEECFFALGKYFLTSKPNFRKDEIWSGVSEFFVHPSYNAQVESYDGDLAIALLLRSIAFTNFIQPICLWTQTSNYNDVINKQGVVAGWGKTESSLTASDEPYWVQLPVVDESTCLRSNPVFLKITSNRTFCVGDRDGRGPCQGDSGGGFIVKNGEKWYLRGIVSSALVDQILQMCDTKNYAVFTDVTQFKDWILQKIELYG